NFYQATNNVANLGRLGIDLYASDRPLVTRRHDTFTSGTYSGVGRWGLFMEPGAITIGKPTGAGKNFKVSNYNADSTKSDLLTVNESGDLSLTSTTASTSSSTGSITTPGGVGIGGNLNVGGTFSAGVSSPSITTSNTTNITGSVTVGNTIMYSNGTRRILSTTFRMTPTSSSLTTSFEFTVPDISTNFSNVSDITLATNSYQNDSDPSSVENCIGYAVTSTTRGKIKFTSSSTSTHTVQIICSFTAN
ncbi:MAG TPA: hypothetical protein V6C58_12220, partial [Allocoleopsis sp.]